MGWARVFFTIRVLTFLFSDQLASLSKACPEKNSTGLLVCQDLLSSGGLNSRPSFDPLILFPPLGERQAQQPTPASIPDGTCSGFP